MAPSNAAWTGRRSRDGCWIADCARRARVRPDRSAHAAALVFDRDADRQVMFETMDWEHPGRKAYWARNQSLIAQSVPLEDALVEDPIQVMFNGGVEADAIARRVAAGAEARGYAVSLTEYVHRDFSLVDMTAPSATKGRRSPGAPHSSASRRDEVMAVGDNFNDVEMLEVRRDAGRDGERRSRPETSADGRSRATTSTPGWRRPIASRAR